MYNPNPSVVALWAQPKIKSNNQTQKASTALAAQHISQLVAKPIDHDDLYHPNYSFPRKIEGRATHCLLETGCKTETLGQHNFDRLPTEIKAILQPSAIYGAMVRAPNYRSMGC